MGSKGSSAGQLRNFKLDEESCDFLERSIQENDFDKYAFILYRLLKKIRGPPEVKTYHLYLKYVGVLENCENICSINLIAMFWDLEKVWLVVTGGKGSRAVRMITTLEFQMGSWVLWHIAVKINENFTNIYYQMQKTWSNCFKPKQCNMILHRVKIDKHECWEVSATFKT